MDLILKRLDSAMGEFQQPLRAFRGQNLATRGKRISPVEKRDGHNASFVRKEGQALALLS
jgi:hypothetical protein